MKKKAGSIRLLKILILAYPVKSLLVLVCLIFGGIAEGIGFAALLPLLNIAIGGGGSESGAFVKYIDKFITYIGLNPGIETILGIIVFTMLLKSILILLAAKQVGYISAHVSTDLRLSLIRGLMKVKWAYYVKQRTGSLINAIATESERASTSYVTACRIIASLIQVAVYTAIACLVSWEITFVAVIASCLMLIILSGLVSMDRKAGEMQTSLYKRIAVLMADGLRGMKALKSMACENRLMPLLEKTVIGLKKAEQKHVLGKEGLRTLQEPIIVIAIAIGIYISLVWWKMELAELMVLALLFGRIVQRVGDLQRDYQNVAKSESAYWSIIQAIQKTESEMEVHHGRGTPILEQSIEFQNVSFSYDSKKVLENVTFSVPANRFTAIVGESGAGKTTIADLLIGLIWCGSGEILIDGMSMESVDIFKWRSMIGYVPQETTLFHENIYTNVSLGNQEISREKVESALEQAGVLNFVRTLPQGLDTDVGEMGSKLSGGQKQRIAIARALVRDPKLLILDEATTALDPKTEEGICETLKNISKSITIFAISHQSFLMESADIVYRIENGVIARL